MKFFIARKDDKDIFIKRCLKEKFSIMITGNRILLTDIENKILYQYMNGTSKVSRVNNENKEMFEKILCSLLKDSEYLIYASYPNLLATLGTSYQLHCYCKENNDLDLWENNKDFMFKVLKNDFPIYYELNNLKLLFNYI